MELLQVGRLNWSVFLTEDVLMFLNDWSRAKQPKTSMTSFLINSVPTGGPQEGNLIVCKAVSGSEGLSYFRKGKSHGEKVRVFWFYGDSARKNVICVRGCVKTQRMLDPEEIRIALRKRDEYHAAVMRGALIVEDGLQFLRRKR